MDSLLHHIALGAADVERTSDFYRRVLGLREVTRHTDHQGELRSIWIDLGSAVLMIERTDESPSAARAPTHPTTTDTASTTSAVSGFFLLAIRTANLEAAEESLTKSGIPIESRTAMTLYFRDPEGNRVALSQHPLYP